ncbi:hypothetical protein D9758_018204 [Tetrapyrgos nigripes]|uniref:Uncharacterized protein n=1 Tax=Tetrapyrgos nigripes TaxID=182062 RepID=A0A8H5C2F0_9AGAR|nr:hypothetical protein D9758_018204 [Tetrapyrgos nigripes]
MFVERQDVQGLSRLSVRTPAFDHDKTCLPAR